MTTLSVIIPVFNEEKNISSVYSRCISVLSLIGEPFEVIFINDGSKDNTFQKVYQLSETDARVKYINLSRNFGHQIAVSAGLDACSGSYAVIIDADLQDPPELITDLYAKAQEGFDVVYAKRQLRKGETFFKSITAKFFYRLLKKITTINIPLDTGDFRIISRKVINVLKQMPEQQKFLRGQIAWVGFRQTAVEYQREERNAGTSGYTVKKMMRLAMDGITSFSNLPLRIATIAGFLVSGITFCVALYALYSRFISKDYVPGWTSIIISVLFIGGVQLITIGIIGEYISRISSNVRNRPLYVVSETNLDYSKFNEKSSQ
ncbi:MAG: putative b-glycosyltransferase, Glycosyltransferase Family 2 protein [Bacteroidota bacterium]|jgi:dolichol-phosphate mannosyltransferase